jgi:hypothetical protein
MATSTDGGGAATFPPAIHWFHWCVGSYFHLVEWWLQGWQLAFNSRPFLLLHRCSSLRCSAHVSSWCDRGEQAVAPLAARREASVKQILAADGSLAHDPDPRSDGSARAARASASPCRSIRRVHATCARVALVHVPSGPNQPLNHPAAVPTEAACCARSCSASMSLPRRRHDRRRVRRRSRHEEPATGRRWATMCGDVSAWRQSRPRWR